MFIIYYTEVKVRFAMGQARFSEGGGNQSITVILGGGQLSQSEDVEVYIDDGTTSRFNVIILDHFHLSQL